MKKGFTLAEALISITIIGIVASITLPALNNKFQETAREAQVKAAYAKLVSAWKLAADDLGYSPRCGYWYINPYPVPKTSVNPTTHEVSWYYENPDGSKRSLPADYNGRFEDCQAWGEAILKRMEVVKVCNGNGVAKGCIPEYKGNNEVLIESYKNAGKSNTEATNSAITATTGSGGYRGSNIRNNNDHYVLADGMILVGYFSSRYFHPRYFAVDVNGKKGPNKWGHDLFAFNTSFSPDQRNCEPRPQSSVNENNGSIPGKSSSDFIR